MFSSPEQQNTDVTSGEGDVEDEEKMDVDVTEVGRKEKEKTTREGGKNEMTDGKETPKSKRKMGENGTEEAGPQSPSNKSPKSIDAVCTSLFSCAVLPNIFNQALQLQLRGLGDATDR